jgi:catechol 2,3-dioxygenase-like lactoylglutathione lyase family enzyme
MITPLLACHSLEQTREYYGSVLGFSLKETAEGTLTVEKFGGRVIFTAAKLWDAPPSCTGTFYFTVPGLEGYYAEVKGKAALAWPLQQMDYGSTEFALRDCNGYTLAFQQLAS